MVGPVVEEIAMEMSGKALVGKLDVDSNPQIATQYGIRSIPTLLVFKNGKVVEKQVGVVPKQNLVALLEAHMG
jgi:thioredoxin 1